MSTPKEDLQKQAQAVVKRPNSFEGAGLKEIKDALMRYRELVDRIDPRKNVTIEATFTQCAILFASDPKLKSCTPASLIGFAIQCVVLGLDPTKQRREAWAVPFKRNFQDSEGKWQSVLECQFQTGYGGEIKLAIRTGTISNIYAYCVYEGDQFQIVRGMKPDIIHIDGPNSGDQTKVIAAYAVVVFKDGTKQFECLNKKQLERLRLKSPMQKPDKLGGMWESDYDEAARAKAVKRLAKFLPSEGEWRETGDGAVITPEAFKEANATGMDQFTYVEAEFEESKELPAHNSQAEIPKVNTPEKVTVEANQDSKGNLSNLAK